MALYININRDCDPSIARMDWNIVLDRNIMLAITFIRVVVSDDQEIKEYGGRLFGKGLKFCATAVQSPCR